ncbi:MAG: hypothetical protein RLZZ385_191 [Pseudomonadota bacterium]|jgi:aspartate aminotransferase
MFQTLTTLNADPILGLLAAFRSDPNPRKIDLGIGVYKDENGDTPVMAAVKEAERRLLASQHSKSYVGPAGAAGYNQAVASLLFGDDLLASLGQRRCTVQTPGGCGGLRIAAEFIRKANPAARVWVSDPTWPNHVPLLGAAGLQIKNYPYYDYQQHDIRFEAMIDALQEASADDVVLLHGCCHNPCGADLSQTQWQGIRDLAVDRGFTVFIDLAYQGLGDGLVEDVYGVRLLAQSLPELIVVSSCSKNFGLYRERVGALTVISAAASGFAAVSSQLAAVARANYSMPPDHGAAVVEMILADPELYQKWDAELTVMRNRINQLRVALVDKLRTRGIARDFSFIQREKGMFSFLGVSVEQVHALINDYSIYLVDSGRINVAGINDRNIDYLVDSLAKVL